MASWNVYWAAALSLPVLCLSPITHTLSGSVLSLSLAGTRPSGLGFRV